MPKKGEPGYDKLYNLRPVLNEISKNFMDCMAPSRELAIDESMNKFKGRSTLKQYLPKKPIKRGYKVWMLANKNGYCQKFEIYTGKSEDTEKNLGARVVKNLLKGMEEKHHVIYFDNYLTSVQLLEDLKTKNIHAFGTVNPSRRLLPNFKPDKLLKRGEPQISTSDTRLVARQSKCSCFI
nr:piggyBac transposable element-derived protein 4-like [Leptinotarsa decemlineata]